MNNPFSHFFHLLLLLSANSNLNFLFTVSFFLHILYASSSSTTTLSLNLQSFKLKSNGIWSRATRRKGSFLITFFFLLYLLLLWAGIDQHLPWIWIIWIYILLVCVDFVWFLRGKKNYWEGRKLMKFRKKRKRAEKMS